VNGPRQGGPHAFRAQRRGAQQSERNRPASPAL